MKASDLHQEATVLNGLSVPCADAGASLLVTNHMNQTGAGVSLKRITMAGSGEWADSWVLLAHREDPDVANGQFRLGVEIGSRQWGGTSWELDIDIGRFDEDTGTHDGDITWDLRTANGTTKPAKDPKTDVKVLEARQAICEVVADRPWRLTKTEVQERVGGSRTTFATAINSLVDDGLIRHDQVARDEAGTTKTRPLWGLITNPGQDEPADVPALALFKES